MLKNSKGLASASGGTHARGLLQKHIVLKGCNVLFYLLVCLHLYASTQDLIWNIKSTAGKHQRGTNTMLYIHQQIAF